MAKNNFGTDFDLFVPTLGPQIFFFISVDFRHCFKLSLYAVSSKTNEPGEKKQFSAPILAH